MPVREESQTTAFGHAGPDRVTAQLIPTLFAFGKSTEHGREDRLTRSRE
jgi:hypothetical protein